MSTELDNRRLDVGMAARAAVVLDRISGDEAGPLTRQVVTRLNTLPAMLRTSGLSATLAFLADRANRDGGGQLTEAYKAVYDELCAQMWHYIRNDDSDPPDDPRRLFTRFAEAEPHQRLHASAHVEALAGWLRRLARAVPSTEEAGGARPTGTGADPGSADG